MSDPVSLREGAIERMARARYENMVDRMVAVAEANEKIMLLSAWDELEEDDRVAQLETASPYLDALLGFLADHADTRDVSDLLWMLRGEGV